MADVLELRGVSRLADHKACADGVMVGHGAISVRGHCGWDHDRVPGEESLRREPIEVGFDV